MKEGHCIPVKECGIRFDNTQQGFRIYEKIDPSEDFLKITKTLN
jgi:hypothetical protein